MRKFLKIIFLLMAIFLLPTVLYVQKSLPVNPQALVEKKYAGWSGVLRARVASDWNQNSDFIRWLNFCADRFERGHEGVYLEFAPADEPLQAADADMVFFSPGMLSSANGLAALPKLPIRAGLQIDARAVPIVMGGYICVRNPNAATSAFVLPPDGARRYAEAACYIIEETPSTQDAPPAPMGGIDLGLPALARSGWAVSETAADDFLQGKIFRTIVTQDALLRFAALAEDGRCPDFECEISGTRTLCDQLLLAGVPRTDAAREALAAEFIESLLSEDAQRALSMAKAFSVIDVSVYPEHSPCAPLEALLHTRIPVVPAPFSDDSF